MWSIEMGATFKLDFDGINMNLFCRSPVEEVGRWALTLGPVSVNSTAIVVHCSDKRSRTAATHLPILFVNFLGRL